MLEFLQACIQLDPVAIVKAGGYLGVAAIIFAESGLIIGILFPGDSLLFVAGLFASAGLFEIAPLITIVTVAAIAGDQVGYWFGANVGTPFFHRKESRFFKKEYLYRTERFFEKYGPRAVVLARFVPIIRTIAPILAGVGSMSYRKFLAYNVVGGLLWGTGVTALGYTLGTIIPESQQYILPITLLIIFFSFLPIITNLMRGKRAV